MDKRTSELFLKLMRCYLCGEALPEDARSVTEEELAGVFEMAAAHHVLPMMFDVLGSAKYEPVNAAQWKIMRNYSLCMVTEQVQRRAVFAQVYAHLLEVGLKPMVVKGAVVAAIYPSPDCRISSDEDIVIEPALRDACAQALCEAGMVVCDNEGEVGLFIEPKSGLRIELHSALFPEYMATAALMNEWFADASERAIEVEIGGQKFVTLAHTDHMLYLVCHAFKHFVHSGFGIRQLCDCMLFALAYVAEIDWDSIWCKLKEIRADVFMANLRVICEKEFGCDFYSAIQDEYKDRIDTDDLLNDLLDAGVYGVRREERKQSAGITLQAVNQTAEDGDRPANRHSGGYRSALFPPLSMMKGRYPYLKKAPVLLPIAWMQRAVDFAKRRRKGEAASPDAIVEVARSRTRLLAKYGVIDQ